MATNYPYSHLVSRNLGIVLEQAILEHSLGFKNSGGHLDVYSFSDERY